MAAERPRSAQPFGGRRIPAVKPGISVLIPAYNGASCIAETLTRLAAAADGVPYEAVIVDNASADGTADICRGIPGVRVIRNEANRGFSRAVNQAAAASSGRVLVAVNQDLHLQPGALARIHAFLTANDALAGGGGPVVLPFSGRDDAPDWLRREVRLSQMRYFAKHRPGWEQGVIRALNRGYFLAHGWTWR